MTSFGVKKSKKLFPNIFKHEGQSISDRQEIANKFNDFFTNIGPKLSDKIPTAGNISFRNYLTKNTASVFNFQTTDNKTVTDVIQALATKSSCGMDEISTKLLKRLCTAITPVLTITINQSLTTGIFSHKLKIAKVILLHKKSPKNI